MSIYILDSPDVLSLSKNPVAYKVYSDLGLQSRLALFVESAFLLGDWKRVYEDERTEAPSLPPVFDFAEVLDGILTAEIPSPSVAVSPSDTHCLRYFVAGREPFSVETLHTTFVGSGTSASVGTALVEGTWYRIEVEYDADYQTGQATTLFDTVIPIGSIDLFEGQEWIYDGKIIQVFQAKDNYDSQQVAPSLVGKTFSIYEIPLEAKYALKGAWDIRDWPYRSTVLPAGRTYASPAPLTRTMKLGQYDWLWLFMHQATGGDDAILSGKVRYTDGTFTTLVAENLGNFEQYRPLAVNISDSLRDWNQYEPLKTISQLELTVYEDGYAGTSETVYLNVDYDCLPFIRELHYFNSLGGFDSIIAYGKGQRSAGIEADESRRYLRYDYTKPIGYVRTVQRQRERFSVSAGYRTRAEREAAKAILISESVYIREGDELTPVVILASGWEDERDGDYRYTLSLDYAYSFDQLAIRPQ